MKWSIPVARPFGIELKVHATFFIILLVGAIQWQGYGPPGMLFGAALMLLLFVCVALHEFGHALVAQRLGIPVREVVLLPIGGVAVLARNPNRPAHELLIAAAGPAVNVLIVAGLSLTMGLKAALTGADPAALVSAAKGPPSAAAALAWLLAANVALIVFNLIPAFPLDGGRILRGLLGFVTTWARATHVATVTGQVIAIAMGLAGLLTGNVALALIAALVFLGAGGTRADERARAALSARRVGDAYNRHALSLTEHDRLGRVVDYILTSYQPDFAVLRGRRFLGVVLREDVLDLLARRPSGDVPVTEVMSDAVLCVGADEPLDAVRARLLDSQVRVAAVFDGPTFLGLVSREDIAEAHAVLQFLNGGASPPPPPDGPESSAWDDGEPGRLRHRPEMAA
jgi:Zn-dependent protease